MNDGDKITFQFLNDLDMVILALENGDIEDALSLLKEIREEQGGIVNSIHLN
jgi:hypothetical protein